MKLKPGVYGYHTLEVGNWLETGYRVISGALIEDFARVSGDFYEIHMDEDAARAKGFDRRVAHGLLVLSVIDGLKNNATARIDALASMGWRWDFKAPVLESDHVSARFTVKSKRLTRSGARGLIECTAKAHNQRGETVQAGQNTLIFDL